MVVGLKSVIRCEKLSIWAAKKKGQSVQRSEEASCLKSTNTRVLTDWSNER